MSDFRKEIAKLPTVVLWGALCVQNHELWKQANKTEDALKEVYGATNLTNEQLALLIDEPDEYDVVTWLRANGHEPRPYQIVLMREPKNAICAVLGRRLGKTWTIAAMAVFASQIENKQVFVAAPMNAQLDIIKDECRKLMWDGSLPKNVSFFATGMKGSKDTVHGKQADLIIADEVDYMNSHDVDAILAMMQKTSPTHNPRLLVTGTPIPDANESRLYSFAHNKHFKTFRAPSQCNPYWTKQTTEDFKKEYMTEASYRSEILAEWTDNVLSV